MWGGCGQTYPSTTKCGRLFHVPTIISGMKDDSALMQEEIFGPVTCVTPFDEEEEVISRANGVRYGLSATVWSRDVGRVHRVARKLQVGLVWTNCWLVRDLNLPFGGMKKSGIGREGGKDSYHFFTEVKSITIKHWHRMKQCMSHRVPHVSFQICVQII